jgi:hypothetical protein
MNRTHAVVEYDAIKFEFAVPVFPVFPVLQVPAATEVHVVMFCGLLFSAQQSCTVVVPSRDLKPAGQV